MRLIDVDTLESEVLYEEDYDYDWDENPIKNYRGVEAIRVSEIENAPTIDAELVRRGHWIKSDFLHIGANQYRCSECWEDKWWLYHFSLGDSNYRLNCGAKMMDEVSK